MSYPVAILGAGTQGRRLAYMWSSRGRPVNLVDRNEGQLERALIDIDGWRKTVGRQTSHQGGLINTFHEHEKQTALRGAWLAIECVPESLSLKRTVIADLDQLTDAKTIIASNSSSYTITEILEDQKLRYPSRFVSLHSYWPPETSAIEVMATKSTESEIVPLLMRKCSEHGFKPFLVRKDSNGYIYNRIWAAIKREALYVAAEGVATPVEIDEIYKEVLKTPIGPFAQMDVVGLDVVKDIEDHYAENRGGLPEEPRKLLAEMISKGKLGVKSGEGFYSYKEGQGKD